MYNIVLNNSVGYSTQLKFASTLQSLERRGRSLCAPSCGVSNDKDPSVRGLKQGKQMLLILNMRPIIDTEMMLKVAKIMHLVVYLKV